MSGNHQHEGSEGAIKFGLVLNSGYTILEFIFGVFTGSLALIADASHNLTDTLTLTISFIANKIAKRSANSSKTYGYGRVTILAAALNAIIMLGVAGFIIYEAIQRLTHPQPVEGGIVAIVASVGILVNASIAFVLYKRRQDLNMRSAFIDMAFDALSSLGAVIAGIVILITGINGVDSVVGLLIAGLLIYNTIKIFAEAVQVLSEGTPKDIDLDTVQKTIQGVEGVTSLDDLHVWSIKSGYNALSCHIIVNEKKLADSRSIVDAVKSKLQKDCNIHHATIEVELEGKTSNYEHEQH